MEQILKNKRIDSLLHFTRAENLPNIFKYGLMPRDILMSYGIRSCFNDNYRYDKCENAVCTTIEFPNYKMFYPLRQNNPDVEWAVLILDARIICDFECAFCCANAGSAEMYSIPIEKRKGKRAFLKLFDESPEGPTRKELGIYDWYPTNPQAEVLVFDTIPITYINKVVFQKQSVLNIYQNVIPKIINAEVDYTEFSYRIDWAHWK